MRAEPKNRISKKALTVWRLTGALYSLFSWMIFIGLTILTVLFDWPLWIPITVLVLTLAETFFLVYLKPNLQWKRWRYEVFEHEIDLQRGVFIVRRTLIPMVRVQHVDTVQGPILRKYHLATVTISTAATVHEIPALELEEADWLRDNISKLARVTEDDV
jgi:uncharacterized protein